MTQIVTPENMGVGKGVQILEENVANISLDSLPIFIFCSKLRLEISQFLMLMLVSPIL